MSLARSFTAMAILLLVAAPAAAQSNFVPEDQLEDDEGDDTEYEGRATLTTFGHRETGAVGPALSNGATPPEPVSPFNRIFADLRLQLLAKHISGGSWDVRADGRVRQLVNEGAPTSREQDDPDNTLPYQSGLFEGGEYEVRELFARRRGGGKTDIYLGRQFVLDIAAIKVDGARVVYHKDDEWDYIAFAGLYPARGSRSVDTDYPTRTVIVDGAEQTERLMPATGGVGAAYRFDRAYGAIGAGGIFPLADDLDTGTAEKPRVFVSSNGYWRQSSTLDLYHFAVVDVQSASGSAVNNLSVGASYHPKFNFRVNASVNHVDTETLNIIAQTTLEDPDPTDAGGLIQNNVAVQRIAQQEARLAVSSGFRQQRFEVSAIGAVRRRPDIEIIATDDTVVLFPEARAADVSLQVLDRRSFFGTRVGASVSRIFGIGDRNFNHSESLLVKLQGSKPLNDGASEVEVEASYLSSEDDTAAMEACSGVTAPANPLNCFGTSSVSQVTVGALGFHRFEENWFAIASIHAGLFDLTSLNAQNAEQVEQPTATILTGFLRVDYRF